MMKNIHLFTLTLLAVIAFNPISNAQYIWAKNGLSMRSAPSLKAEKLKTFPYGTKVETLRPGPVDSVVVIPAFNHADIQFKKPFYLYGNWVRAYVGRDTGYFFDGYLSKMAPYDPTRQVEGGDNYGVEQWLLQQTQIIDTRIDPVDPDDYTRIYANHVVMRRNIGEGGGSDRFIFLSHMTFNDGFLLLNYFYNLHLDKKDLENCEHIEIETGLNFIRFSSFGLRGGLAWMFYLYFDDGMLVIEDGGGC